VESSWKSKWQLVAGIISCCHPAAALMQLKVWHSREWFMCYLLWLRACCHWLQVSKGLWKKYGDRRVRDTPITEVVP